jgi:mannose/cellobiose epimerase-like protein (N-acyl-D-glucosamine 2-epimerase family)
MSHGYEVGISRRDQRGTGPIRMNALLARKLVDLRNVYCWSVLFSRSNNPFVGGVWGRGVSYMQSKHRRQVPGMLEMK